jgi:serpin B
MMKCLYLFLSAFVIASCDKHEDEKILSVRDSLFCKAVSGQNDMGFDMLREISKQEPGKNILISPTGLFLAMSITANGAADSTLTSMLGFMKLNGFSKNELNLAGRSVIHYLKQNQKIAFKTEEDSLKHVADTVEFAIASLLCMPEISDNQFKKKFISDIVRYYATEPKSLNFSDPEALAVINGWVAEKTNNRIKEILKELNNEVSFIIMNALYFKGKWKHKFDPGMTTDRAFKLTDTSQVIVPMMEQMGEFELNEDKELSALVLPYYGGFSMVIILPKKTDGLDSLLSQWNDERWSKIRKNMSSEKRTIIIPKFKYEYSRSMADDVINLGMSLPFNKQQADFSDMADSNLYMSQIIQKTFIEVDEKGTEAAAVTIALGSGTGPVSVELFRADHPFLFMIVHDQTGIVVFSGMVRHFEGALSKPPEFPENMTDLLIDLNAGKLIGSVFSRSGFGIAVYPLSVNELDNRDPYVQSMEKAVDNNMGKLLDCYSRILEANPNAKGILKVKVVIDSGGRVIKTSVKRNMLNSEFGLCAGNIIRKWKFPEHRKSQLTVDLQFVFIKQ